MISKQYFETTFSLETAQALQIWANNNLITPEDGDYGMKIAYLGSGLMFAETAVTGLDIGTETIIRLDMKEIHSNNFKIYINAVANDNSSAVAELGWGEGIRTLTFTPTATTMYLAIGDNVGATATWSIVDNVTTSIGAIQNGTFEAGNTDGWYAQNGNAVLSVYQYVAEPPTPGENPYTRAVDIPPYVDTGDDTDGLITTSNGRFTNGYINREDIQHFYIEPGNYGAMGSLTINQSGTASQRKSLSLLNGNDTHPGKLDTAELAIYDLLMTGASYWDIDRYHTNKSGGSDTQGGYNVRIYSGSQNNTFNRMFMKTFGSMMIGQQCHSNTVQYSRYENQNDPGYDGSTAIQLAAWGESHAQIHDTHITACEFYNCNDAIAILRMPVSGLPKPYQEANMEGTVVYDNTFHKDIPYMENAIDATCGSENPDNPIIIQNNVIFGYKRHPDYVPGSYVAGFVGIMVHIENYNLQIMDNMFYECGEAVRGGDNSSLTEFYGSFKGNSKITGNVFYKSGDAQYTHYCTRITSTEDLTMDNNYYIDQTGIEGRFHSNIDADATATFANNSVSLPFNGSEGEFTGEPGYPNSATFDAGVASTPTVSNAGYTDFTFNYDIYTNDPKQTTLPNVLDPAGSIVSPV